MVGQLQNPSQGFEDVVKAHFYLKKERILQVRNSAVIIHLVCVEVYLLMQRNLTAVIEWRC